MDEKSTALDADLAGSNLPDHSRRGFLECMAWAGIGVLWTSDSHIGFSNAPNTDVVDTLREAVDLFGGGVPRSQLISSVSAATPAATAATASGLSFMQMSTAFPQPAPGTAPLPGPIKDVPPGKLRSMLGIARVSYVQGNAALAVIGTPLGA